MTTNTTTASQPNAAPSGGSDAVDALRNIRDVAYLDATPSGKIYYAKAENALAAIECRDAVAAPALPEPAAAQDDAMTLDTVMRDMLAIQDACGLHTDEYAPGSVIEYIKELEVDAPQPLAEVSAAQAVPEAPRKMQVNKARISLCRTCVHEPVAGDTYPCNCCWNPIGDMYRKKPTDTTREA